MIHPDPETAPDEAARPSRLFLASFRQDRIADARVQLEALHDVTPRSPRLDLSELQAGPGPEPKAADEPIPYTLTAKAKRCSPGPRPKLPQTILITPSGPLSRKPRPDYDLPKG